MFLNRYPIYIPSRGRYQKSRALTVQFLMKDKVPFRVVVEEDEYEQYVRIVGKKRVLVLPFRNKGLYKARCWIMEHSISEGHERHWQLDDNILRVLRKLKERCINCASGVAFRVVEDFTDRYENIAISGLNYEMFVTDATNKPFVKNAHVYSCTLVNNKIPHRWRLMYNDDTDFCLQVLSDGWCTILVNAFMVKKVRTMLIRGGNTDDLYQGDGRLNMARSLERVWPYVVSVARRFGRPQHVVRNAWKNFDTPLKLKPGIDLSKMKTNDYGMQLVMLRTPATKEVREFAERNNAVLQDEVDP